MTDPGHDSRKYMEEESMQNDRKTGFTSPGGTQGGSTGMGASSTGSDLPMSEDRATGFATSASERETGHESGVERAKTAASQVGHRAVDTIENRIEDRKSQAAERLHDVASSLRSASDRVPPDDGFGRYIERAASQVDNLANFLDDHEVEEFVDDVERFARQQPAVFIGGAFALGFLGARFLKSSRSRVLEADVERDWSNEQLTSRIDDPTRDGIGRPGAPGYVTPEERFEGEFDTRGSA